MTDKTALRAAALVLLLFLIVTLLCSCGEDKAQRVNRERFMLVEQWWDCNVYVDLQTGAEYVERGGAFAPLIDSFGQPIIFSGFDAREDRVDANR